MNEENLLLPIAVSVAIRLVLISALASGSGRQLFLTNLGNEYARMFDLFPTLARLAAATKSILFIVGEIVSEYAGALLAQVRGPGISTSVISRRGVLMPPWCAAAPVASGGRK
ncbi:hypothetical protein WCQ02_38235 [Paraburkholderia tropica]|uniref:hypothetical protein n=1 Tax=Paraburkholderia tropica TaxID=92647 RepID=UPI0030190049